MTVANIVGILGVVVSLAFGIWSVIKSGRQQPSRAGLLFLVLAFLYGSQFVSAKWLGHTLLSETLFGSLVTGLIVWIFFLVRDA